MTKPKVIEKTPISIYDVKKVLDKNKKALGKDEELNFRVEKTIEYTHRMAKVPYKTVDELKKKIEELSIPRLKEKHIAKILEIMPTTEEEVSAVLKAYPITVSKEDMKKVAKTVKEVVDDKYLL